MQEKRECRHSPFSFTDADKFVFNVGQLIINANHPLLIIVVHGNEAPEISVYGTILLITF
jgi:hypothetical protein